MKLFNQAEFENYLKSNFELFLESNSSEVFEDIPGSCDVCGKDVFLKVHSERYHSIEYKYVMFERTETFPRFIIYYMECPSCLRKSFVHTIQLKKEIITGKNDVGDDEKEIRYEVYKLFRLPTKDESFENKDIPKTYTTLKKTVSEAIFCLSYSKYIASSILFRRAIQIIAKDVLGAQGKRLHNQLEWLKINKNKLEIELVTIFHDNSKIIKDIGNQAAHPDDDITLHDFTKKDANGLHDLFLSIIGEIFIKPAQMKELQDDIKKRRKLK